MRNAPAFGQRCSRVYPSRPFPVQSAPCTAEAATFGVITYNWTSWKSAIAFLREAPAGAHVVLLQETHLLEPARISDARASAVSAGWNIVIAPAIPSRGTAVAAHYNTGGVAVAVRNTATVRSLELPEQLEGRAAAAEVLFPGIMGGRITVVTLYLVTGASDEEPNRRLLAHLGVFLHSRTGAVLVGGGHADDPSTANRARFPSEGRVRSHATACESVDVEAAGWEAGADRHDPGVKGLQRRHAGGDHIE